MPANLDALLRRMRLPYLRGAAPDVIATGKAQRWDPAEVLRVLINEIAAPQHCATNSLRKDAS